MTTTPNPNICPECHENYGFPVPSRFYAMVSHMVNKGEITLGEARAELATCIDRDTSAMLAGWIMDRSDQDDSWRAGDPVRLPDGTIVAYGDEHNWAPMGIGGAWVRTVPVELANEEAALGITSAAFVG